MTTKSDNKAPDTSGDDGIEELLDAVDDSTDPVNEGEVEKSDPSEMSAGSKAQLQAANVVPIHAATGDGQKAPPKRGRGRPKKIKQKPTSDDLAYHQQMQAEQVAFVEQDAVFRTTCDKDTSEVVLQATKERLSRLVAVLEWQRIEEAKYGKLDGALISRQVAALKEVAQIELKIRELGVQMFDLRNPNFQKVFGFLIETFRDVAHDALPEAQFDLLFNKLETELEGWEDRAENLFVDAKK